MGKATVYIRVKNEELWKKLGDLKSDWLNKKLEEDASILPPDHYDYDEAQQKWVEPTD